MCRLRTLREVCQEIIAVPHAGPWFMENAVCSQLSDLMLGNWLLIVLKRARGRPFNHASFNIERLNAFVLAKEATNERHSECHPSGKRDVPRAR